VFMATGDGTVKKVELEAFSRPRTAGIIAIDLDGDDKLVGVALTNGDNDIMMFSNEGQAIRFHEGDVRAMGRNAAGVRGIRMPAGVRVVSLMVADPTAQVLTACANGFGKRTPVDEFRLQGRGGGGTIAIQTSDRNGELVAAVQVHDTDQLMLISDQGTLVRTRVDEVRETGRNAQGVTLIKLDTGEKLVAVVRVDDMGEEDAIDTEAGTAEHGAGPETPSDNSAGAE